MADAMSRRHLFRLISYSLLGILLLFLLVVYALYLSAQRKPAFYRDALATTPELRQIQYEKMKDKLFELNNALENTQKPWSLDVTAEDLNAYFAVELTKPGANILPREMAEPRIRFSDRQLDFACRVNQGNLTGVLHLTLGLEMPETNRLSLRIKNARLGKLPISRDKSADMLAGMLEKKGCEVRKSEVMGDPVLSITRDLKYGKDRRINLEKLELRAGVLNMSGETEKQKDRETGNAAPTQ